jgi:nitroimidazol reductase NimA-like FMN-containing flavoprotein (pyridoxamine 5'-phosphate oxidase superfamily)
LARFPETPRSRVTRLPDRGRHDRDLVFAIVDEALVCHVAFVQDQQPFAIPILHARDGDTILLHGSAAGRLLSHLGAGHPVAMAFTLVDGLVMARSAFHHSVNYRSAVVFGRGAPVEGEAEKAAALERFTERLLPGRWAEVRPPSRSELKGTAVVRIAIESASAKVRTGPPADDEEDLALPVWAGVLPAALRFGEPVADPKLAAGTPVSPSVLARARR